MTEYVSPDPKDTRRAARVLSRLLPAKDASIGQRQYFFALVVGALLVICGVVATPYANVYWYPVPGYMTAFGSSMVVINVLLAALLFSRGTTEGDANIVRLGIAYFFVAVIFMPLTASFPDALIPGSIIGSATTPVWLWVYWHGGFGLGIIYYALGVRNLRGAKVVVVKPAAVVVALVVVLTGTAVALPIYLPNFLAAGNDFFKDYGLLIPYSIVGIDVLALFLVASIKPRTPEQLWLTVAMLAAVVDVWLTTQGLHRFSLGWYVAKVGSLFTSLAVLISLFHGITTLYRSASDRANRDGLTGLNNRRRLNETLNIEWKRARRQAGVLSFLMIDVDAFKQYNDTYGHLRGDECLRRIASVLLSSVNRPGDMVARYGGEEFCALLPATDAQGAVFIAHQIGAAIRADRIAHAGSANGIVTVSIGVATCRPNVGTRFEDLIDAADQALYRAKDAGRNRVEVNELEFKLA